MRVDPSCPRCGKPAPLLDNNCPSCRASLMTTCFACGSRVHFAEPSCWSCRVAEPGSDTGDQARNPTDRSAATVGRGALGAALGRPSLDHAGPVDLHAENVDLDDKLVWELEPEVDSSELGGGREVATRATRRAEAAEAVTLQAILSSSSSATFRVLLALATVSVIGVVYLAIGRQPVSGDQVPSNLATLAPIEIEWDGRIASIARAVENTRGLTFQFPVDVEVLTEIEFDQRVDQGWATDDADDGADPPVETPGTVAATERSARAWDAVLLTAGLLPPTVSPSKATPATDTPTGPTTDTTSTAETPGSRIGARSLRSTTGEAATVLPSLAAARYDVTVDTLYLRGETVTPLGRIAIGRQLLVALVDQHSDIGDGGFAVDEAVARRSLIEGDADRITAALLADMSVSDRSALEQEIGDRIGMDIDPESAELAILMAPEPARGPSDALVAAHEAPFRLGSDWLGLVLEAEGRDALSAFYADPPDSTDHLLFPLDALVGHEARRVDVPTPGPGEIPLASGRLGVLHLLLLIGERTNFQQAWTAVTGTDGDVYLLTRRGSETCLRVSVAGRTLKDLDEVDDAFRVWAETVPGADIELQNDVVTLGLCNETGLAPTVREEQTSTWDALVARAGLVASTQAVERIDRAGAECIVDLVRDAVGIDELAAAVAGQPSADFEESMSLALEVCSTVSNPTTTTVPATTSAPTASTSSPAG